MAKIIPIKPEFAYPELMYRNLREQKMAMRVRMRLSEAYSNINFSVEVKDDSNRPTVVIYLKDFPHKLFSKEIKADEFTEIQKKWDFVTYLSSEFKDLREDLHTLVMGCFTTTAPVVYIEVIGSIIQRSLKY